MSQYSSDQVMSALRKRFDPKAWAVLEQVRNGTGFARDPRTADAIAVSLWPSRGLELHGIEIKVSRSDFTRELKDPAKAEAIQRYCHRWWIAAPDEAVAPPSELPPTWGLLVLKGETMRAAREAPLLEPRALDMHFVAAVLRRAGEAQESVRKTAFEAGREKGQQEGQSGKPLQRTVDALQRQLEHVNSRVAEFEKASGIQIANGWEDLQSAGEAIQMFRKWRDDRVLASSRIEGIARALRNSLRKLEAAQEAAVRAEKRAASSRQEPSR